MSAPLIVMATALALHAPTPGRFVPYRCFSPAITQMSTTATPQVVQAFVHEVEAALSNGSFVKLTLGGNEGSSTSDDGDVLSRLKRIQGKLVKLKVGHRLQLTLKYEHRDVCKNVPLPEVGLSLESWLRPGAFRNGRLMMTEADLSLEYRKRGQVLQRLKPTITSPTLIHAHDRQKMTPVATENEFLRALGVVNTDGRPKAGKADKLRQIQKFVETLSALVRRGCGEPGGDRGLRIVDAGCGRGYLTFAAHSYFASTGWAVETTGVDMRADLMTEMNAIARDLGGDFEHLTFERAAVADFLTTVTGDGRSESSPATDPTAGTMPGGSLTDTAAFVLIALHACDTATDDALWCGIANGASVIVTAPCCHKQVRRQLEGASRAGEELGGSLRSSLRHGIYRERTAEMVTDSMRALLLDLAGYDVSVFEFIGGEHTAKNVMLAATRRTRSRRRSTRELARIRSELGGLAADFGVRQQALASWMDEPLYHTGSAEEHSPSSAVVSPPSRASSVGSSWTLAAPAAQQGPDPDPADGARAAGPPLRRSQREKSP